MIGHPVETRYGRSARGRCGGNNEFAGLDLLFADNQGIGIDKPAGVANDVHAEPFEVPGVGKLAVCAGPDGSMFGLGEWHMEG